MQAKTKGKGANHAKLQGRTELNDTRQGGKLSPWENSIRAERSDCYKMVAQISGAFLSDIQCVCYEYIIYPYMHSYTYI